MNTPLYLRQVTTLTLDSSLCDGCRMCLRVCPHAVFTMRNKRAVITDRDRCMECGACSMNCHSNAIQVLSGKGCGCATGIIEGYFRQAPSDASCNCC